MAKKAEPIITYKEILCLAIGKLEDNINYYREKAVRIPENDPIQKTISCMIEPMEKKQDALKQLYQIETGAEYI